MHAAGPGADVHPEPAGRPRLAKTTALAAAAGLLLAWFGQLHTWQRGLYVDDYCNAVFGIELESGRFHRLFDTDRLEWFPARVLSLQAHNSLAALMLSHEWSARAFTTALIAANSAVLGLLIYRCTASPAAALLASAIVLSPSIAHEAVLWPGAAMYPLIGLSTLVFLHVARSAIVAPRFALSALPATAAWGVALLFGEAAVGLLAMIPATAADQRRRPPSKPPQRTRARRALVLLAAAAAMAVAWYALAYRGGDLMAARGGASLDPRVWITRAAAAVDRLAWMYGDADWVGPQTRDVLAAGYRSTSRPPGFIAFYGAAALAAAAVWRAQANLAATRRWSPPAAWCLLACAAAALFPLVLVPGQMIEGRMLYLPLLALAAAAGFTGSRAARTAIGAKLVTAAAVLIALSSTLSLHGWSQVYASRGELDRRQIDAVARAVVEARAHDPNLSVFVAADAELPPWRPETAKQAAGVFDTDWTAIAALRLSLKTRDVLPAGLRVLNRWSGLRVGLVDAPDALELNGEMTPLRSLLFLVVSGGDAQVATELELETGDGGVLRLPLPVGMRVGERPCAARLAVDRVNLRIEVKSRLEVDAAGS